MPFTDTSIDFSLAQSVADHVPSLLGYWDQDEVCRFANSAYVNWFGEKCRNMVGTMTIKDFLGPNYERNLPYILGALKGQVQSFEREVCTENGEIRYVLAYYYPDIHEGEVQGFFAQISDISHLKLLQQKLKHSNEIFEQQTDQLERFTNIAGHDLKTYAYSLKEITAMLETAVDHEERTELIGYLKTLSTNFSSTVNNVGKVADLRNQRGLEYKWVDINELLVNQIELVKLTFKKKQFFIKNDVVPDIQIYTDPTCLASIILNLLTNAVKYRDKQKDCYIRVNAELKGNNLMLKFEDNGLGIDLKKYGARLFQIYQTFHSNKEAKGLGLYITKMQLDMIGGKIRVESTPGIGSTFIVNLPIWQHRSKSELSGH